MSYKQEAKNERNKKLISRSWWYLFVVFFVGTATVFVLFFLEIFDVRTVTAQVPNSIPITDVTNTIQDVLDQKVIGITRRHNSLIFSKRAIIDRLKKNFPKIDSVEVIRSNMHDLIVVVTERKRAGLWCIPAQTKCYDFDDNGIAFAELAPSSGALFVPIQDHRERSIILGSIVESADWRNTIFEVKKNMQFAGIPIAAIEIPSDSHGEFHIKTQEGWQIYLGIENNINLQMSSLTLFLKDKITPTERKAMQYIDLRIDDRIYYK